VPLAAGTATSTCPFVLVISDNSYDDEIACKFNDVPFVRGNDDFDDDDDDDHSRHLPIMCVGLAGRRTS